MKLKCFGFLLAVSLLVLSFSCSDLAKKSSGNKSSDKDSAITLNWIGHWQNREGKEQMIMDIAREFEFQNQECRINLKFPAQIAKSENYRPYLTNLYVDMIRTGKVDWDIILLDHYLYDQVANRLEDPLWGQKYLVDFEQLDWFKERHKPFIYEEPFYRNNTGGTLVGPFIEAFYSGLWYNKALAEKMGISVKDSEMKLEDFKEYFKKGYAYNQKSSEKIVLLGSGGDLDDPITLLNSLVVSQLDRIDTTAYTTNLAALKKGLEAIEELSQYKPIETYGKKVDQQISLRGEGLFVALSSWVYNKWAQMDSAKIKNMEVAELPVFEKDGPAYQGTYQSVFAVFKNSPHKDMALNVLKYMSSQYVAEKWLSTTKNPTGLKTQLNATELMQDEIDVFNYKIDKKYGKNFYNYSLFQLLFGVQNRNIKISVIDILNGKTTAAQAYDMVVKQLKAKK